MLGPFGINTLQHQGEWMRTGMGQDSSLENPPRCNSVRRTTPCPCPTRFTQVLLPSSGYHVNHWWCFLCCLFSRPDKFHWRSFLAALLKSPLPPEAQLEIVASSSKEGVENTVSLWSDHAFPFGATPLHSPECPGHSNCGSGLWDSLFRSTCASSEGIGPHAVALSAAARRYEGQSALTRPVVRISYSLWGGPGRAVDQGGAEAAVGHPRARREPADTHEALLPGLRQVQLLPGQAVRRWQRGLGLRGRPFGLYPASRAPW
jgi:hypothetical protein